MARARKPDIKEFQPPTDPKALIVWANKRIEDGHRIDEFAAKQNLSFLLGNQWGVWDNDRRRFAAGSARRGDPNAPVRVTVNKIAGLVERTIARLTKTAPIPECRPVTDTLTDVHTAQVATRILDHEMDRLDWHQRLIELYFWVLPLGWSFFHIRWDPDAGPIVGTLDDEEVRQGEVVLDEVPAFEIRLDPNARRWRDALWCTRTVAMTKEAVYEQYGVVPEAEDAEALVDEWDMATAPYTDRLSERHVGGRRRDSGKYVAVHQLWIKPGGRVTPEGLVVTWCGKTILEDPMPFPYTHGELPFIPLNMLPALGGDPGGRTWVSDLVALQKDYNDARSREAMIRRVLTPKILAARGQIDPNRISSRVEVIDYNPTGPAPTLQLPDGRWMAQFESAMNRSDAEMGDRSGQQEVSQGKAASSAPAASILALQEADETKLAISAKELTHTVKHVGFQILMLVRQFWQEDRVVRTFSRDGALEVDHFSGANIGEQLDVHVSAESGLPRSKSAKAQMAIDLWSQGIITDATHFVRMLDLPGTDFLVETLNLDSKQAEREHGHLLRMEPVEARVWHNHEAHLAKHDEFRKSEEYERLEPDAQAWFDGHVQAHMQLYIGQLQGQAMLGGGGITPDGGQTDGNGQPTNPSGANGEYTNALTGAPQDPLQVAAGLAPSSLAGSEVQARRGSIGGTGNAGPVPGVSADTQAYRSGN